jgi:POTRA domain, FtsQ-type
MSGGIPVRASAHARRRKGPRRASAGLTPGRAAAALVLVLVVGAGWGLTASEAFTVSELDVAGTDLTPPEDVARALALVGPAPNAFTLATDPLGSRLAALPTVAGADVRVVLPDTLRVRLEERRPILVWRTADRALLVDREGRVLADAADPAATDAARRLAEVLPSVDDRRTVMALPGPGSTLEPLQLDIATRLLSLRPADVGSGRTGLVVALDDADGWIVQPAVDDPWTAVFGIYTADLRPADIVPAQVRLLRSLLAGREATVARVVLADAENGTFLAR